MSQPVLTIDLDAIAANWRALAALGHTEAAAVVKADAYGLGAGRVAPVLARAGARKFFVAEAAEGARLRGILGPGPEIFILTGHMAGDAAVIREAALTPMLASPEQAHRHLAALPGHPFGVQVDTGMNRLGLKEGDWRALAPALIAAGLRLVLGHLACADEPGHPMNEAQLQRFRRMTGGMAVARSFAATGGILLGPDYHFDLTRPGVGLYGGAPFAEARAVVRLSLPVVQVRQVAEGETVGYGNAWTATRPARIATLGAGYADGLHRALAGRARVFAGDIACPLVGRVSMDLTAADVTALAEVPEALDILGPQQGIDALAAAAGTIGYEILTGLGPRFVRRHTGGGA